MRLLQLIGFGLAFSAVVAAVVYASRETWRYFLDIPALEARVTALEADR